MGNTVAASKALPVDTSFKLPSPLPSWPSGEGFGTGIIDLGGLKVCQISSFQKVWMTREGGPDNLGASFFEPTNFPDGFFMLGCYSQPNNKSLHGWVLVAKDEITDDPSGGALKQPTDYTLVWSSQSLKIKQDTVGYIWQPISPDGYKAVGHVVTISSEKPALDKVRCVRSDLTDQCESETWIWGLTEESDPKGFNVYGLRPTNRGVEAMGVSAGTFVAQNSGSGANSTSLVCLKNAKSNLSAMPNLKQVQAIFQVYSPRIYLHPDEKYSPSSVSWYFKNGALLYKKGEESMPKTIEESGSNLPQGGANDGSYWMDLPVDKAAKERVKKGDIKECEVYLHVKPMMGATFTDIAIWIFYPFNGGGTAKVGLIDIPLGKVGQHVGDWEHATLRISNFTGELWRVYLSQHSSGSWINASEVEFHEGNKPVTYASLNGHALYGKAGRVMQGNDAFGIRNDTAKSDKFVETGARFQVVAGKYLGSSISEPLWLNYLRKWGPDITYRTEELEKLLPEGINLPNELFGEQGPTGPILKRSWTGDEI